MASEELYGNYAQNGPYPYLDCNNKWGWDKVPQGEHYTQCLTGDSNNRGWRWNGPTTVNETVYGFPFRLFGKHPFDAGPSTTELLPKLIKDLTILQQTYDIEFQANGVYNLATELWVTSKATDISQENIVAEIMIWHNSTGQRPAGDLVGTRNIEGIAYDVYKTCMQNWGYIAYVAKEPQPYSNKIDLLNFIENELGHSFSTSNYLASVEFGNEICSGNGRLQFNNYNVEVA